MVALALLVAVVITGEMTVSAKGRDGDRRDTPLYALRSAKATGSELCRVSVVYLAQGDNSNPLGFPAIAPDDNDRPSLGHYTDIITDCYTNGCYTCYPSAGCYSTCYANPCGPTIGTGTCGAHDPSCETMFGTCHTDCGQETCVMPCGPTTKGSDMACWFKEIMNDPFIITNLYPCDW